MTDLPPWTPGPWIALRTLVASNSGDINRREVQGYERHRLNTGTAGRPPSECGVYQTRSVCRLNEFMGEWTAEDQANLRLIIASPAMAAALETAQAALRKLRQSAITRHGAASTAWSARSQAWDEGEIATEALDVVTAALINAWGGA